jgi:hypothetical protein
MTYRNFLVYIEINYYLKVGQVWIYYARKWIIFLIVKRVK